MKTTKQFCHKILANIGTKNAKAFTNTVISLSSYEKAQTVVQLSESPLFHHQYSSLRDGIAGVGSTAEEQRATMKLSRQLALSELDFPKGKRVLLQTDASSMIKAHSRCLPDRQYVKINNNVIRKNQPISIGYPVSLVNLSPEVGKWSIPIDVRRVDSSQSAAECAVEQIEEIISEEPLSNCFIVNTLDTGYGNPNYLCPVYEHKNLANLVRFTHGRKVWTPKPAPTVKETLADKKKQGAPGVYGDKYYLTACSDTKTYYRKGVAYEVDRTSIFDMPEDDYVDLVGKTSKNRPLNIQVWRWNNLLIRTKDGKNMKDKPFDLVASYVADQKTGELVFKKPMFVVIHGQRKDEISTKEAFEGYRKRYDIEPSIKFAKRKLLLDKYQTPSQQHFDNWLVVVMMSFWLLFHSRKEIEYQPKKWQQYTPVNQQAAENSQADTKVELKVDLTPSQARQGSEAFFLTLNPTPFLPKTSNKGKGREKDTKFTQRTRHPVVKKSQDKTKIKIKIEKIE